MLNPLRCETLVAGSTTSAGLASADAGLMATLGVFSFLAGFWATVSLVVAGRAWRRRIAMLLSLGLLCGAAAALACALPPLQGALQAGLLRSAGLGLLGMLVGFAAAAGASSRSPFHLGSALGLAFGMSLLWVSSYQYLYNIPMLNSPHLNYSTFLLWGSGLFAVVGVNRKLETVVETALPRTALLWLLYLAALLVFEFIGYELLEIREVSKGVFHQAMFFGLIHGPWPMKAYYLSAGLLVVWADQAYRASWLSLKRGPVPLQHA